MRPINPLLSRYPLPLSEAEAREDARRARRKGQRLPAGHPYCWAPTVLGLDMAARLERVRVHLVAMWDQPMGVEFALSVCVRGLDKVGRLFARWYSG